MYSFKDLGNKALVERAKADPELATRLLEDAMSDSNYPIASSILRLFVIIALTPKVILNKIKALLKLK